MKLQTRPVSPHALPKGLLILPVLNKELTATTRGRARAGASFQWLDRQLKGQLRAATVALSYEAKPGSAVLLQALGPRCELHVLLVSADVEDGATRFDERARFRNLGAQIAQHARQLKQDEVLLSTVHLELEDHENLMALIEGVKLGEYRFDRYKASGEERARSLRRLVLFGEVHLEQKTVQDALVISEATALARDLVNTPARDCTPTALVQTARQIARTHKLKFELFDRSRLERMGAHLLLGVAAGSDEPPYLIKLTYRPKGRARRCVSLVGKGVTFDSGGLSIKPATGMESMKVDMSGAAAVLATMQAVAELEPRAEVRAYIPTTENMISGRATRPGDVITGMRGKSVEILNTDAEGRLILADALTLAERDRCDEIIDLATLTGACVVALGGEYAGLFSSSDELANSLATAAENAGERLWRMPLAPEYRELIKSSVADIKNTGGRAGGAITAALFLKEFVEKTPWAHLDIAGPASSERDQGFIKRGGVGFGVRTLCRYLLSL